MKKLIFATLVALVPLALSGQAAEKQIHEFVGPPVNQDVWCPCQLDIEANRPEFLVDNDDPNDRIIRITAFEETLGGNNCTASKECPQGSSEEVSLAADEKNMSLALDIEAFNIGNISDDDIPPSMFLTEEEFQNRLEPDLEAIPGLKSDDKNLLFDFFRKEAKARNPFCTPEVWERVRARGEEIRCMQRQELRFQKNLRQSYYEPHEIGIRFRMPGYIHNRKDSIRWVLAQWKHDRDEDSYMEKKENPFLAVRFDDGVLHVTLQDEYCRCTIASAPHPDPKKNKTVWKDGKPSRCFSTLKSRPSICTPGYSVKYVDGNGILSEPLGEWVTLRFELAPAWENGRLVIYDNNRRVAEVTGRFGYVPNPEHATMKLKIGQYRGYQPSEDTMDVDWVSVSALD